MGLIDSLVRRMRTPVPVVLEPVQVQHLRTLEEPEFVVRDPDDIALVFQTAPNGDVAFTFDAGLAASSRARSPWGRLAASPNSLALRGEAFYELSQSGGGHSSMAGNSPSSFSPRDLRSTLAANSSYCFSPLANASSRSL